MTGHCRSMCGAAYERRRNDQKTCPRYCLRQRNTRLQRNRSGNTACPGACLKRAVRRTLHLAYAKGLYAAVGITPPDVLPASVMVMHAVDSRYWHCRHCGINIFHEDSRCQRRRPNLHRSPRTHSSRRVDELAGLLRKAGVAGVEMPPIPPDARHANLPLPAGSDHKITGGLE